MKKHLVAAAVVGCAFSSPAWAANAPCPALNQIQVQNALKAAVKATGGTLGLGLNMWATIVAADGRVCIVANSSGDAIQGQWLASRVISAQKAFGAATLSLGPTPNSQSGTGLATGRLALSSANLYSAVNPGGSLYGLQHSNPVAAAGAYGDRTTVANATGFENYTGPADTGTYGTPNDPMIGQVIGGINVFGGGLGLYRQGGVKVGGVGVSGDTSCTDHLVAWRLRHNLGLDHLASIGGVSGDTRRPDNIIFDITPNPNGGTGVSAGGFGHPTCLSNDVQTSRTAARGLPPVTP